MYIVYIIKSLQDPSKNYVGFTTNLEKRLQAHNAKKSLFSRKYSPWKVESFVTFCDEGKARSFEKYLKKGSGHAFLKKRLI